jgi:hypothetical protein
MPVEITMKRDADHDEALATGEVERYKILSVRPEETNVGEISHVIGHDSVNIRCSHNSTRAISLEGEAHIINACAAFALISTIEGWSPDPQPGETWELFGRNHDGTLLRKAVQIISRSHLQKVDGAGFFQPLVKCTINSREAMVPMSAFFSARQLS